MKGFTCYDAILKETAHQRQYNNIFWNFISCSTDTKWLLWQSLFVGRFYEV